MLSDQTFSRYSRQIALSEIGEQGQKRLINAHVLIIGCGGLGSAAALYLAGAGVGRMVLVDDDTIESSNLHRQVVYRSKDVGRSKTKAMADQLTALNSDVQLRGLSHRLDEAQLSMEVMLADIVLDCSDNIETRHLINQVCYKQKTPLISAAAIGWQGQFAVFDYSDTNGCYRCLYPFEQLSHDTNCQSMGVVGAVVGILGNYQALAALQMLALDEFIVATGQLHLFDGKTMSWQTVAISRDSSCLVCGNLDNRLQVMVEEMQ